MKTLVKTLLCGCGLLVGTGSICAADEGIGAREYKENCAICHGATGKGNGPLTEHLKAPLPNLTVLAKNNNGVFPFERVYQTIDGRNEVKTHGPRDMPVWGNRYNQKAAEYYFDSYKKYDAEAFVRGRILALVVYIHEFQEK